MLLHEIVCISKRENLQKLHHKIEIIFLKGKNEKIEKKIGVGG
jgi:hypothetical protein